jgi:hypothetical protein
MRGPGLISGYLDALAGQLPGPVVEELAGGLEDTYRRHLGLDLAPEAGRIVPGVILAAVVALLAVAARGIRYRAVGGHGRMCRHRRAGWFHDHRRPGR